MKEFRIFQILMFPEQSFYTMFSTVYKFRALDEGRGWRRGFRGLRLGGVFVVELIARWGGQEVYIWVAYPLRIVNVHGYAPACGWDRLILLKNVKCLLLPK